MLHPTSNVATKNKQSSLVMQAHPEPSRHCLGTIIVKDPTVLLDLKAFMDALQRTLSREKVQYLGQFSHVFSNGSFTAVVALAESHISVHTWPERKTVQLDVFLCNYINDNREKCKRIFDSLVEHFDAVEVDAAFVDRS